MFTGLIGAMGKVVEFRTSRLRLSTPWRLQKGESVAIDGVCLTVENLRGKTVDFNVGPETRRITTLGSLKMGQHVNLERALRVGDRLGGHWVTGHVEGTGRILSITSESDVHWVSVDVPRDLMPAVLYKGSLSVDGISLTVARTRARRASFMIIPHTWSHTTLSQKKVGDSVNLETDLLARYALRPTRSRKAA
jgi:riboflavin synthase alpha subunit